MTEPPDDPGSGHPHLQRHSDLELVLPPPTPVSGDSTAGVVVRSHLRKQTAALLAADAGLDDDLPDAVHASRVAARRLRSGLRIYGDLLTDDLSVRLRPELSWYAGQLSPVRDLEVFTETLSRDTEDADGYGDVLLPWLRHRHAVALAAALPALRSSRADALRVALARVATDPRFTHEAAKRAVKILGPRVLRFGQCLAVGLFQGTRSTLRDDLFFIESRLRGLSSLQNGNAVLLVRLLLPRHDPCGGHWLDQLAAGMP